MDGDGGGGGGDRKQNDSLSGLPPRPNNKNPRNFSLFLRPSLFNKPKLNRDGAAAEELASCGGGSSVPRAASGDITETGHRELTKAECDGNVGLHVSRGADGFGYLGTNKRFNEEGRDLPQGMGPSRDPCFPAMSACSQGASNDPRVSLKRRYEECRSLSQSQSDGDDWGSFNRAGASTKDCGGSAYRLPGKRRGRTKEKLRALQELLPNCNKVDQVGVLDEAIEYLKTLQQQFLVLSTGSPMYMPPPPPPPPPPVMLPAGIQQMYAVYPGQFPVASVPTGMSLGAGLQFPLPPGPSTTGFGLQQPLPCTLPFGQSTGCSSLSPEYSQPTNLSDDLAGTSDDDLVDTSDGSESISDGRF